jgi:hypothetical protein
VRCAAAMSTAHDVVHLLSLFWHRYRMYVTVRFILLTVPLPIHLDAAPIAGIQPSPPCLFKEQYLPACIVKGLCEPQPRYNKVCSLGMTRLLPDGVPRKGICSTALRRPQGSSLKAVGPHISWRVQNKTLCLPPACG